MNTADIFSNNGTLLKVTFWFRDIQKESKWRGVYGKLNSQGTPPLELEVV